LEYQELVPWIGCSHCHMPTFATVSHHDLLAIQDGLRAQLRGTSTLEEAARHGVQALCRAFSGDVVLARLFLTMPFGRLPADLHRAAWNVVEAQSLQAQMTPETPVLALLATCGTRREWCNRRSSQGHAAIPLSSRSFVDSIPMVARMLQDMGIDLGLKLENESVLVQKILGAGWVGLFYVDDARSARDDLGRRVVPAVDFVEEHGIRTVFGLGKAYGNGSIASFVVFTNKLLPRRQIESLVPYVNLFMASTFDLMRRGEIFEGLPDGAAAERSSLPT